MKLFLATKMKCAVVSALISLALVSQAFAVLRPLFPAKPAPPFNGEVIIIGDDSVTAIQIVRPLESIAETQSQLQVASDETGSHWGVTTAKRVNFVIDLRLRSSLRSI